MQHKQAMGRQLADTTTNIASPPKRKFSREN
jgi:hypothetical protein